MNIEVELSEDQITELITEHLHTIDVDELLKHVALQDAIDFIQTFDNGVSELLEDYGTTVHEEDIAKLITFENSHLVARSLYLRDSSAAQAMLNEISYWMSSKPVGQMK